MQIIHCDETQLEILAELFNKFRIFYEQETDLAACPAFIQKSLAQARSKVFLLLDEEGTAVGFSQLYPAICSLAMRPYYYLSDLYVIKSARKKMVTLGI